MKPVEGKVKAKATGPAQVITPDQKLKEEMKKKGLLAPVPQSKKKKGKKKTPRKKRK